MLSIGAEGHTGSTLWDKVEEYTRKSSGPNVSVRLHHRDQIRSPYVGASLHQIERSLISSSPPPASHYQYLLALVTELSHL